MPQVEVSFGQVLSLIDQLDPEQRFQVVKSIAEKRDHRDKIYAYAEQLAKEKGFDKMTDKELENLLHEE